MMQIYTSHSRCTLCFSKKKFPWNKLRTACVAYFAVCLFVVVVVFNEIRKLSGSYTDYTITSFLIEF